MNYIPGWDCHGLPIELKALQEASHGKAGNEFDSTISDSNEKATAIRDCARAYADKAVETQRAAFRSWNIVADWDEGCYFSYDPKFELSQLDLFYQMFQVRRMLLVLDTEN